MASESPWGRAAGPLRTWRCLSSFSGCHPSARLSHYVHTLLPRVLALSVFMLLVYSTMPDSEKQAVSASEFGVGWMNGCKTSGLALHYETHFRFGKNHLLIYMAGSHLFIKTYTGNIHQPTVSQTPVSHMPSSQFCHILLFLYESLIVLTLMPFWKT